MILMVKVYGWLIFYKRASLWSAVLFPKETKGVAPTINIKYSRNSAVMPLEHNNMYNIYKFNTVWKL